MGKVSFFSQKGASGTGLNENPTRAVQRGSSVHAPAPQLLPPRSQAPHLTQKAALSLGQAVAGSQAVLSAGPAAKLSAFQDPDPFSSPGLPGSRIL